MSIDVIGNFLTIIRNGLMASKAFVLVPSSRLKLEITKILKDEGFIRDYMVEDINSFKKQIKIILKYVDGESVIHDIRRVSTPGCRYYSKASKISPVIGGLGLSILSTNNGIISHKEAKAKNIGGEVICTVW